HALKEADHSPFLLPEGSSTEPRSDFSSSAGERRGCFFSGFGDCVAGEGFGPVGCCCPAGGVSWRQAFGCAPYLAREWATIRARREVAVTASTAAGTRVLRLKSWSARSIRQTASPTPRETRDCASKEA